MYEFDAGEKVWVCAINEEQAINLFKIWYGEEFWQDGLEGDTTVREMSNDEVFTYYHDGSTPEEDTIGNHLKKYCSKPDMFAVSAY